MKSTAAAMGIKIKVKPFGGLVLHVGWGSIKYV